jgi:hypothetical protein
MTTTARIVEIQERGQRYFPRADLVDSQGQSLILPETRQLSAIEVTDVTDGARLMALGLIGYLPLTAEITLNIVPKFPIKNLWTMLEIGGENYRNILPTIRRYQTSPNSTPIQMLARSFCHYLRQAVAAGFERSYYARQQTGYYKPRVEFGPTINQFISRGNPVDTVSNVFEFGLDSPVNRVIKAACVRFASLLPDGEAGTTSADLFATRLKRFSAFNRASLRLWILTPKRLCHADCALNIQVCCESITCF